MAKQIGSATIQRPQGNTPPLHQVAGVHITELKPVTIDTGAVCLTGHPVLVNAAGSTSVTVFLFPQGDPTLACVGTVAPSTTHTGSYFATFDCELAPGVTYVIVAIA